MNRTTAFWCTAGLVSALHAQPQQRPNIVVFLVDDMGLMDTSLPFLTDEAGRPVRHALNAWYHTPNMERLAALGTRFSTFYAQSVSSPSRTSLLTGQNAARHRTTNWINAESNNRDKYGPYAWNWQGLTAAHVTYPRLLQEAGYRTIHVGKAHFSCAAGEGADPCRLGFDVNIGGSAIGQPGSYLGRNGYGWIAGNRRRAVPHLEAYHGTDTFLTDALTREALAQVEQAVAAGRPFFLNLSHYAVHQPFESDPRFAARYEGRGRSRQACAFATLIEGMDKSLGDVLDGLERLGVAGNTFIIFLGDNGSDAPLGGPQEWASSAPLRGKKGAEYEGGMRVPFIAAWAAPDADNPLQRAYPVKAGALQQAQGTVMDIFPTVLSVAGVPVPRHCVLDGSDLRRLLAGKRDASHRTDFLMHFPHEHRGSYFTAYRDGDWKLIYYYRPETPDRPQVKLYNLRTDPTEQTDLAPGQPRRVKRMVQRMTRRLDSEGALYPVDAAGHTLRPVQP